MKLKYIISEHSPIVFNEIVSHDDVAKGLGQIKSAGFVYVDFNKQTQMFDCKPFGKSVSLGIESNIEKDKYLLDRMFNSEDY